MVEKIIKGDMVMYAKIQISGDIEVKTGMHIGGSSAFAAIGAVDSPIIKDIRTNLPMIPGSSFKGKMRSLLAKEYNEDIAKKPDDDAECLLRLFGCAKKDNVKRSRIIISDMIMKNEAELREQGLQSLTEVKFENTINRVTAVANPRQIERAIRGSKFDIDIVYEVEKEDEVVEDIGILAEGLKLLEYDYIGGNGSRGYGKIAFENLQADVVVGQVDEAIIEKCNELLNF
jgi:CRISPR-associated protein Csm3